MMVHQMSPLGYSLVHNDVLQEMKSTLGDSQISNETVEEIVSEQNQSLKPGTNVNVYDGNFDVHILAKLGQSYESTSREATVRQIVESSDGATMVEIQYDIDESIETVALSRLQVIEGDVPGSDDDMSVVVSGEDNELG